MSTTRTISTFYHPTPQTTIHVLSTLPSSPTQKPALIVLPFWGGTAHTYFPLLSLLPQYPSHSISLPGFGLSTSSSTSLTDYSITSFVSLVYSLLPLLHIPSSEYILVGHSMGAKIVQLLASFPPAEGRECKGTILLAPAPPTPLMLPVEMAEQQKAAYSSLVLAEFVVRNVLTAPASGEREGLKDEAIRALAEDMVGGSEMGKRAWVERGMGEDILGSLGERGLAGIRGRGKGKGRALVVVGNEDLVEPKERVEREVVGRLRGEAGENGYKDGKEVVEFVVLEGVGHLLVLEGKEKLAEAIGEWIERVAEE